MLSASKRSSFIIGGALLACPVTDPGVQEVKVLLPGSGEVTYSPCSIKSHCWKFTCTYHAAHDSRPSSSDLPLCLSLSPPGGFNELYSNELRIYQPSEPRGQSATRI